MTNELTVELARNLSDEQLQAALAGAFERKADAFKSACVALNEIMTRGIEPRGIPSGMIFRLTDICRDVAIGAMSPLVALECHSLPMARAIARLPMEMQEEVIMGRRIKIAEVGKDGRVGSREVTVREMKIDTMRLVFSEDGITPWEEQGEWLIRSGKAKPQPRRLPRMGHDPKTYELRINGYRLRPDDLIPHLAAVGYELRKIRGFDEAIDRRSIS